MFDSHAHRIPRCGMRSITVQTICSLKFIVHRIDKINRIKAHDVRSTEERVFALADGVDAAHFSGNMETKTKCQTHCASKLQNAKCIRKKWNEFRAEHEMNEHELARWFAQINNLCAWHICGTIDYSKENPLCVRMAGISLSCLVCPLFTDCFFFFVIVPPSPSRGRCTPLFASHHFGY